MYKVINMTPMEAHDVFDGPACAKKTIKNHMKRLAAEKWYDASMSILPDKIKAVYGKPDKFPPFGFRMRLVLHWNDPHTQADVNDFNFCLTLSATDQVGDDHTYAMNLEPCM